MVVTAFFFVEIIVSYSQGGEVVADVKGEPAPPQPFVFNIDLEDKQ